MLNRGQKCFFMLDLESVHIYYQTTVLRQQLHVWDEDHCVWNSSNGEVCNHGDGFYKKIFAYALVSSCWMSPRTLAVTADKIGEDE